MKLTITTALLALMTALPAWAADVYRCEQDGHVTFSQTPCGPGGEPCDYSTFSSASGLRPGERALLDQVEAREAEDRAYKRFKYDQDKRHQITYSDRLKIRELEMERDSLSKSLTRGSKSYGETAAIREQIRGINRQIEQIKAPKW